jgi:hypothetical protein
MNATPATSQYLKTYISERLPVLKQEDLDPPGHPLSFTEDRRYIPLHDPVCHG